MKMEDRALLCIKLGRKLVLISSRNQNNKITSLCVTWILSSTQLLLCITLMLYDKARDLEESFNFLIHFSLLRSSFFFISFFIFVVILQLSFTINFLMD